MTRLIVVLGDQLSHDGAALRAADKASDVVMMAEVRSEASYVGHHKQKLALIFAAMRRFADELERDGWDLRYTRLSDAENAGSLPAEIARRSDETGASEILVIAPGEWRLRTAFEQSPLKIRQLPDDRFFCSEARFGRWAEGRKEFRMEWFYREMRRETGLLMEGDAPAGGAWNFDKQNRKPAQADLFREPAPTFRKDALVQEVLEMVAAEFPDNFGTLETFNWPVSRAQAERALAHFVEHNLRDFGPYQDAMLHDDPVLYHAKLSAALNIGLLSPREVCEAVQAAYDAGDVPIQSAEGFIRQILGWREYMRGIYFLEGPDYTARNALRHARDLPWFYWTGETDMACMRAAITQTRDLAYAHHIQRLMVTGNFALLAGVDPAQVQEWYLAVYIDAFEWVEAPNTAGMSQFADGGIVGSKPYISSGAYIDRMSDYCSGCAYDVRAKSGEGACPFNSLYWQFLERHRARFESNPRMALIYRNWDRQDAQARDDKLASARALLERLDAGDRI
ncbi:deoxyribodipyrimidine photolyase [Thioclava dalianensis]|uniref:Deoxyribodipyrimidine photolyase n=1 Tax=Thioclava dalianensis TaxID=1185766 RepID=A0A074TJ76_9RHOB|nr:cryptochrome/photolyase family protein [Thioclava dalianensis]KEP70200.1 deoxyribodipyrimidine photolyase [Thioclava dalianensis]SFM81736.1 deoxyribodipyrimidine photolyase-related protein [Thioclava dalianensis]